VVEKINDIKLTEVPNSGINVRFTLALLKEGGVLQILKRIKKLI